MKDKEKQITEFIKYLRECSNNAWAKGFDYAEMDNEKLREFLALLPEDSVVLSMEELAQKIYDDIFAILKIKLWLYGDDTMTKNLNGLTKQKILDFTKKWGIKDNHLNEKDYSHIDHLQAHDKQIKDQASKETAEEYHNEIERLIKTCLCMHYISLEHRLALLNDNNKLAKQFGVEIKE